MNPKALIFFSTILFMAGISLTGCAPSVPPQQPMLSSDDGGLDQAASIKLAEASASVSHSLVELAEIEKAVHPGARIPPPPNAVCIGMAKLASVNWTGPVEPLIRKIATITHYRVRVLGKSPAIPALVSISAKNTPLADILRDASFQVMKKADVVLYPRSRVIEIRYRGT